MSHQRVADECGVTKGSVVVWEKETAIPIQKLAVLALWGFDVQYIATGLRSPNLNQLNEELGQHESGTEPTRPLEIRWLRLFRALNRDVQNQAMAMVKALVQSTGTNPIEAMKPPKQKGTSVVISGNKNRGSVFGDYIVGNKGSVKTARQTKKGKRR